MYSMIAILYSNPVLYINILYDDKYSSATVPYDKMMMIYVHMMMT